MSYEIMKSMTYRNNKVYTRQSSNNVYPKDFSSMENKGLTKLFNELGKKKFEKWFISELIMTGNVKIMNNSNTILKRLNNIANILWNNQDYINLYNKDSKLFNEYLYSKDSKKKVEVDNEIIKNKEDMEQLVSSFYDKYNLILNKEKVR